MSLKRPEHKAPLQAGLSGVGQETVTAEKDEIQKRIIDLELISDGYEALMTLVLSDREWRKNSRFIDDLEATVRNRQQALMDALNGLVARRDKKSAQGEALEG